VILEGYKHVLRSLVYCSLSARLLLSNYPSGEDLGEAFGSKLAAGVRNLAGLRWCPRATEIYPSFRNAGRRVKARPSGQRHVKSRRNERRSIVRKCQGVQRRGFV